MLRAKKGHRGFVVLMLNNSRVYFQASLEKTPFFQNISILLFGRLGFGLKFRFFEDFGKIFTRDFFEIVSKFKFCIRDVTLYLFDN
jgi:hypothetical protein